MESAERAGMSETPSGSGGLHSGAPGSSGAPAATITSGHGSSAAAAVAPSLFTDTSLGSGRPSIQPPGNSASASSGGLSTAMATVGRRIRATVAKPSSYTQPHKGSSVPSSHGGASTAAPLAGLEGAAHAQGSSAGSRHLGAGSSAMAAEPELARTAEGDAEGKSDGEGSANHSSPRSSLEQFSILSPPEGSDVENVLQLICNIFQLPVALVSAFRCASFPLFSPPPRACSKAGPPPPTASPGGLFVRAHHTNRMACVHDS